MLFLQIMIICYFWGIFKLKQLKDPWNIFPYFITEKRKCNYVNVNVNVIRDKNILQKPRKPLRIDLIMIKMPKSFQNSQAIKTGLSDSHKMHLTLLKVFYNEQKPLIQYRSCKKFTNEAFIKHLQNAFFFSIQLEMGKPFLSNIPKTCWRHSYKKYAVENKKCRADQAVINKITIKEIMKWLRLRNKFLNTMKYTEKHTTSNATIAFVLSEKQIKNSLALLIQLM